MYCCCDEVHFYKAACDLPGYVAAGYVWSAYDQPACLVQISAYKFPSVFHLPVRTKWF